MNVRPSSVQVLAQSATALSVTGTTAETSQAIVTIPSGLIGERGALRVTPHWTYTNSGNAKTLRVRFGTGTFYEVTGTNIAMQAHVMIRNRTLSSQVSFGMTTSAGLGTSGAASGTGTAATGRADQELVITCQLATASETCTLEGYTVELLKP